jgi:hypothetical protein
MMGFRVAIDRLNGGKQLGRIGHVPHAARMHDQPGFREGLHHRSSTTGMIQVNVGQKHIGDVGRGQP